MLTLIVTASVLPRVRYTSNNRITDKSGAAVKAFSTRGKRIDGIFLLAANAWVYYKKL